MATASRIVIALYDRVLETRDLAPFFEGSDMRALIEHQSHVVAAAMGGPPAFSDAELRAFHAGRDIDARAFGRMMGLLRETLSEFGIVEEHTGTIVAELEKHRAAIVSA